MARTLDLDRLLVPDQMASAIIDKYMSFDSFRMKKKSDWEEIRNYVYAVDTTTTSNQTLPWKNKTTIPKLTQIYDNLFANYMATIFPKRKFFIWTGDTEADQLKAKAIQKYMFFCVSQQQFKEEIEKLINDYILCGNCFVTPVWKDYRQELKDSSAKVGFVGPSAQRISCDDIVFDPTAPSFRESPKIVRSIITLGDLKGIIESQLSGDPDEAKDAQAIYDYFYDIRMKAQNHTGLFTTKNQAYKVDGFTSFESYLTSGFVEVITFHGDLYVQSTGEYLKNHIITIVDRHKIIGKRPNPSWFGYPPFYHAGWRVRQDNLWAMGPLDNLIGMQYRIDHLENLKADVFDLTAFPPLAIKGYVEEFVWAPMARIQLQDDGAVQMLAPDVNALNANTDIANLAQTMEEMAGAPKEAMGFRTPGEKTKYEVQRLENAAARIFQSKITQFEEKVLEPLLNSMLEMAKRLLDTSVIVSSINEDYDVVEFEQLTKEDITGSGTLRPIAARNFAEKSDMVQNLTNFYGSAIGQDQQVIVHFSGLKTAKLMEDLLELTDYNLVTENIRIAEQAESQQMAAAAQENAQMAHQTPSGLTSDDSDPDLGQAGGPTGAPANAPPGIPPVGPPQ